MFDNDTLADHFKDVIDMDKIKDSSDLTSANPIRKNYH